MNTQQTIYPAIEFGGKGLFLSFGQEPYYFNYYWLRDNCPSSIDPQTRERIFDVAHAAEAPRPETADIQGDKLVILWKNEDHRSEYDLAWLEAFITTGQAPDAANMPRKLWYKDHAENFKRFKQADIETNADSRQAFSKALIEDGVVLVTDMEDSDESLTRLVNTQGPIVPSVDGYYFDVKVHINPVNLAFTANALEMHTDLPSEDHAPGVQFLHCRANTVEGGYSLFLDGAAVAEDFRKENPEGFELLARYDIPFFRRNQNFDYRSRQHVIELDANGNVSGVTISQHLADTFDLPQEVLDDYYPAFVSFIRAMNSERYLTRFRLNAGECIVFDNHRIVHGRESYTAESGERHLRGCYTNRGAVESTYRIAARR